MTPFVFSKDQMRAGITSSDESFATWYVREFMEDTLKEMKFGLSEETLISWVQNGLAHASFFGFSTFEDRAMYVTLMWECGPDFYKFGGFREILADRSVEDEERMRRLWDVDPEVFADAFEASDPYAWTDPLPVIEGGD